MAGNEVRIVVSGDSRDAEAAIKRASQSFDQFAKQARAAGLALSAVGAAGVLVFTKAVKSAVEEERGINLLDQALRNVGQSYDAQRVAIEAVIEAQQRKTNFGDGEQREALQKLLALPGDYEGSLAALPALLDTAAGLNIDLAAASTLVGRGLAGNTELFSRYGIEIEKGASQTELITKLLQQFGGSAAAASDPLSRLNNRIGDVFETFGKALLPIVEKVAVAVEGFARVLAALDPKVVTVIAVVGGLAVAFAAVAGPVLLFIGFIPQITAGLAAVKLAFMGVSASATTAGLAVLGFTLKVTALAAVVWAAKASLEGMLNQLDNWTLGTEKETDMLRIMERDLRTATKKVDEWAMSMFGGGEATEGASRSVAGLSERLAGPGGLGTSLGKAVEGVNIWQQAWEDFKRASSGVTEPLQDAFVDIQNEMIATTAIIGTTAAQLTLYEGAARLGAESVWNIGRSATDALGPLEELQAAIAADTEEVKRFAREALLAMQPMGHPGAGGLPFVGKGAGGSNAFNIAPFPWEFRHLAPPGTPIAQPASP